MPPNPHAEGGQPSALPSFTSVLVPPVQLAKAMVRVSRTSAMTHMGRRERPIKSPFGPLSHAQLFTAIAFWAVILLGVVLRFWGLGDRPLHHDESLHAYFSMQLMHNLENWSSCLNVASSACYRYDPWLHGPFQFHIIAFVYKVSQILGAPDQGINTTTVRIAAAVSGSVIVGLPYFLRDYLGKIGAWLACFLLAISPSMVYFSRFAREDIYMACFTLLLVVAVARYIRSRQPYWLTIAVMAYALSYATKEATFLTVMVFGSFCGALLIWELSLFWRLPGRSAVLTEQKQRRYWPRTVAPILLLVYFITLGGLAKWFFGWLKNLSIFVTASSKNTHIADLFVQTLKERTLSILSLLAVVLTIVLLIILFRDLSRKLPRPRRPGLAAHLDARRQPLLATLFTTPWNSWFFACMCGIGIFLVLFTVEFTNVRGGIGDGIWQGLYYWLQQQQMARGGQPWYYYFMLIPLYEQIGLVFGIAGVIRCLLHPSRFRLFLVFWFVGNVFIYSWAGEKMPWLMIHMTMPMLLLAAIGLEPAVTRVSHLVSQWVQRPGQQRSTAVIPIPVAIPHPILSKFTSASAIAGVLLAIGLLLPTLQNMYEVTYVHAADAPHEMMIYVQTTPDINIVMARIDALDQQLYGGKHLLAIGVTDHANWPFAWYLRDYSNVCFKFPTNCQKTASTMQVIIADGDNLPGWQSKYEGRYAFHQYHMRTQWDQGYMEPPCVKTASNPCTDPQPYVGVGPLLWLSYGDNPPPSAQFNLGLAASNIWQWWWQRKAIGSTDGTYDMGLFILKNLHHAP